jgi:hypothetical protein
LQQFAPQIAGRVIAAGQAVERRRSSGTGIGCIYSRAIQGITPL